MNKDKIKEEMIEFFHQLGFTLHEIKDNVFMEQKSVIDCSTILYDDAVKIYAHLSAQYEKLIEEAMPEMREKLSEIEHAQWTAWSKSIAETETISPSRLERWQGMWCPYEELMEVHKDQDREWADKALDTIRTSLQERGIKIK